MKCLAAISPEGSRCLLLATPTASDRLVVHLPMKIIERYELEVAWRPVLTTRARPGRRAECFGFISAASLWSVSPSFPQNTSGARERMKGALAPARPLRSLNFRFYSLGRVARPPYTSTIAHASIIDSVVRCINHVLVNIKMQMLDIDLWIVAASLGRVPKTYLAGPPGGLDLDRKAPDFRVEDPRKLAFRGDFWGRGWRWTERCGCSRAEQIGAPGCENI